MSLIDLSTFPRSSRLTTQADYRHVFNQPRVLRSAYWQLFVRANDLELTRLGIVVTRRHDAKAVGRNRLKRLVRESFRHVRHQLGQFDVVVMAKKGTTGQRNNQMLVTCLNELWQLLIEH